MDAIILEGSATAQGLPAVAHRIGIGLAKHKGYGWVELIAIIYSPNLKICISELMIIIRSRRISALLS